MPLKKPLRILVKDYANGRRLQVERPQLFSQASHNSRLSPVTPVAGSTEVIARVDELIADLKPDRVDLLTAFHRIQHELGYVPREAVPLLAGKFQTTPALIYGAIDFYSEIRTQPSAAHEVEWCSGPACLLKGSMQIRRALESTLGCFMNQTSLDGKFGLRLVQCDGTCHLAPLIRYRGKYIGPLNTSEAIRWARALKAEAAPEAPRVEAAVAPGAAPDRAGTPSERELGGAAPGGRDLPPPSKIAEEAASEQRADRSTKGPRPPLEPGSDPTREPGE